MGHPEHEKVGKDTLEQVHEDNGDALSVRYIAHLEQEVRDLRRLRDSMMNDVSSLRAELWDRGMTCARYKARADAERKNAELLFGMLVELESKAS